MKLLAAIALFLCAATLEAAETLIPIRIGYPVANIWPLYLARDLKLFEKAGLDPHFTTFTTGAPLILEMKEGSIDVAWTGLATLPMLDRGISMKFVMVTVDSSSQLSMVVPKNSPISGYQDLPKSRAIGAARRTCAEVSAVMAAHQAGSTAAALNIINLPPNLLLGAMQSGQIDSAFIWGPWHIQLRDAGFKIVAKDRDYSPDGGVCATAAVVRTRFLEQNPSAGCRLVKVQALALEAARRDPELAIRTIQQVLGLSYEQARESFETLAIPSLKSQLDPRGSWTLTNENAGLSAKLLAAADALYEAKSIKAPLTKDAIWAAIDARYIKQYLDTECK